MSKARLVITALFVDHQTPAEVAARYGVHRAWVYKLKARYEAEGEAAFEPRSRRPQTSPRATAAGTVDLIIELRKQLADAGLDAGPDTIAWHLSPPPRATVSRATISRNLGRAGLVTPEPKKRPKSSYIRFEAADAERDLAVRLHPLPAHPPAPADRALTWRSSAGSTTAPATPCTSPPTPGSPARSCSATFRKTVAARDPGLHADRQRHGLHHPTVRRQARQRPQRASNTNCADSHVVQKNSRPNHPTTCGKVERFQQTLKKWLRAQPPSRPPSPSCRPSSTPSPHQYNHRRPHRSLPHRATPATVYDSPPKATPGTGRDTDTHDRIRHDRIDKAGSVTLRVAGRLHHIGIGRTHAGTYVILLVQDLHDPRRQRRHRRTPPRTHPRPHTATTSPPEHPKDPPRK